MTGKWTAEDIPAQLGRRAVVTGGAYVGPDGRGEMRGHPALVKATARAYEEEAAQRLWETSERLTGVSYDFRAWAGV